MDHIANSGRLTRPGLVRAAGWLAHEHVHPFGLLVLTMTNELFSKLIAAIDDTENNSLGKTVNRPAEMPAC